MAKANNSENFVSDFKLKFSYWYIIHKFQLRKLLIIFLIVFNISLFGYSIYRAIMILFIQQQDYTRMVYYLPNNPTDYNYFRQKNKPREIQIAAFEVIAGAENRNDFIIKLTNPNEKWVAKKVAVQLISAGGVVAEKTTFIYPQDSKYIAFFNQENTSPTGSLVRIAEVLWERYLAFSDFARPRLNFEVSDTEFKSAVESGIKGELPVSILKFKIKNATAYNYWQVGVYMILLSAQKVGGANFLALDQFRSGETRTVEMRWYEPLPPIYDIEIIPEVDILDSGSYMPPE